METAPIELEEDTITVTRFIQQLADLSNTRANYIPRMIAELENGETETEDFVLPDEDLVTTA